MKPLDPAVSGTVHQIVESVQGLPVEIQLRALAAASLMHGHYDEAIRLANLARQAAKETADDAAQLAAQVQGHSPSSEKP